MKKLHLTINGSHTACGLLLSNSKKLSLNYDYFSEKVINQCKNCLNSKAMDQLNNNQPIETHQSVLDNAYKRIDNLELELNICKLEIAILNKKLFKVNKFLLLSNN